MKKFLATFLAVLCLYIYAHAQATTSSVLFSSTTTLELVFNNDTIKYTTPLTFCEGGSVLLEADGVQGNPTFQWKKNGVPEPGANGNTYLATTSGNYTVVVNSSEYAAVIVLVLPKPDAAFTFIPNNQCGSIPINFSNTSTGTGLTYEWSFDDPNSGSSNSSTEINPNHLFIGSAGNGMQTFNVTLIVTNNNGCKDTVTHPVTIKQLPDPTIQDNYSSTPFVHCGSGSTSFTLQIDNGSSTFPTNASYSINWGDNTPILNITSFPTSAPISHTYNGLGYFNLTVTVTGQNGCSNSRTYSVYNGSNPAVPFQNPGSSVGQCVPFSYTIPSTPTNNPPGTIYIISTNDGSPNDTLTSLPPTYTHTFLNSSCGATGGITPNTFFINIRAKNPCGFSDLTIQPITTNIKPKAKLKVSPDSVACVNSILTFTNTSIAGVVVDNNGVCNNLTKNNWVISPSTGWNIASGSLGNSNPNNNSNTWGSTNLGIQFTTPGEYTISIATANVCGNDTAKIKVCIQPVTTPSFTTSTIEGCGPLIVSLANTSTNIPNCGPYTRTWSVVRNGGACVGDSANNFVYISNTNANSNDPVIRFNNSGNYTITLSITTKCGTVVSNKNIIVKAPPKATIGTIPNFCGSANITPSSTVTNCGTGPVTYAWSFPGGTPAISTNSSPGSIFYGTPGTYTVSLTVTNECGTNTTVKTFVINPLPTLQVPANASFCPGQATGPFNFISSGNTVSWSSTSTSIGLPSLSGVGNISSFNAANNTTNPISATITATTASGGCISQASFTITVNPKPAIPGVSSITYCQGSPSQPLTAVTAPGNIISWFDNPALNNPLSTPPTPSTTTPGVITYYVTQTNSYGCTSSVASLQVTITSAISNNNIASDQTVCSGTSASLITQSGAPLSGGNSTYSYMWQQSVDGGISWTTITGANGSNFNPGNINATTRFRRIVNSGTCSDTSNYVTITVLGALSNYDINAPQTICEGDAPSTLLGAIPTGGNGSFTYQWQSAVNASGPWSDITGATGVNYSPSSLLTSTYFRRKVVSGQCTANSNSVLITVKPKPNATIIANPTAVCATSSGIINFSATGLAPYTIQLLLTDPAGNITTLNQTINANTGTITVVPSNSIPGIYNVQLVSISDNNSCIRTGTISTTSINIKSIPAITITPDTSLCSGSSVTLTATGANTYSWSPGGQSGNSITINPAITTTYSVTGTTNGCSNTVNTTVTVYQKPVIPTQAITICSGNTFSIIPVNSGSVIVPPGTTYSWPAPVSSPAGAISGGSAQTGQSLISQTLLNTTNSSATLTYTVTPVSGTTGACIGSPFTITVTVSPQPGASNQATTICSGQTFNATPSGVPAGTNYTWSAPVSIPSGIITGGMAQTVPIGTISQVLTNQSNQPANLIYTVSPTAGSCGSSSFTVTVTVNPRPVIPNQSVTICTGDSFYVSPVNSPNTIIPAGTTYTWNVPTMPSGVSGAASGNSSVISGMLVNNSNTTKTVTYNITPTSGADGNCVGAPFSVTVLIDPSVAIGDTSISTCSNLSFSYTPTNSGGNIVPAGTTFSWTTPVMTTGLSGGVAGSGTTILGTLQNNTSTTQSAVYTIVAHSGNCPSDTFQLSVQILPKPNIPIYTDTICSGANFSITPMDGVPTGNIVPTGTVYTWNTPTVAPSGAITGGFAQLTGVSTIGQTLINVTNQPANITYNVTPKVGNCTGQNFTITITVNPKPKLPDYNLVICSGQSFNLVPVNNTPGTIVPPGTTYSWSNPVSNPAGAIVGGSDQLSQTSISEQLTNITNAVATITYQVVPTSGVGGNCIGEPFNVTITVHPQPGLSDTTVAVCSGGTFNVAPVGAPAGTMYNWVNPVINPVGSISGGSAMSNQVTISQTLINNTNTIASILYTVTPTVAGSCGGSNFIVKVRVAPKPQIPSLTTTICTSNSFSLSPQNNQPSTIVPSATTYTWSNPVSNPPGIVTGGSAQGVSQSFIGQQLFNMSDNPATLNYSVLPVSGDTGNCQGAAFPIAIIVNPDAKAVFNWVKDTSCAPFGINNGIISLQQYPGRNQSYLWYVNNNFIGAGTAFPGFTMMNNGDSVTIKLVAISSHGCRNDSMEHKFYTYVEAQPSFTLSDTVGCGPLTVTPINTTPNVGFFSYQWDFGNGQTSLVPQPGAVLFASNPSFGDTVYIIKMKVISACDTIIISKAIRVKSKPKALFTPNSSVGCSPMTVTFNNISKGLGNIYTWDFGDGSLPITTAQTTPIAHTFITGIQDTFFVKLIAVNDCGSDSMTYAIVVSPNTVVLDFAINGNQQSGCIPHTVSFINNSQGASTFTWDFGDGSIINTVQNIDTVTHTYLASGIYTVILHGSNGCSDTSSIETIVVYPKPVAAFTATPALVCVGNIVQFTNQSDSATSYLWYFGDGNTSTATNPTKTYNVPGIYTVKLIAYRYNAVGSVCLDSLVQQIQVVSSIAGSFIASDSISSCAPFTVTFTNLSVPAMNVSWDFGDGTSGTGSPVSHTYTQAGAYLVSMIATAPTGCSYQAVKNIQVKGPSGTWTHTTGYICNGTANFQVNASNTDTLIYQFGDGNNLVTTSNMVFHTYANPGIYYPTVILKNSLGCSVSLPGIDSIKVDIVSPGFAVTQQANCGYTKVAFTDTSHFFFGTASVIWDFGDGTTGFGLNTVHNYTTSGSYPVRMIVKGNSNCTDTVFMQLVLNIKNNPAATILGDTMVCLGNNNTYSANIQSIDAVSFIKWTVSNGVTSTTNPFTYKFTLPGSYKIDLVVGTVHGCYDTVTNNIVVNPSPTVISASDLTLCRGNSTVLNTNGTGVVQYNWTPLQGLSCTTCASPIAAPLVTTPYVVTGANVFGCTDADTVVVTVIQPFELNVNTSDTICIGESTNLLASGASSYNWSPAIGLSNTTISNPIASPMVTTNYRVVGYDGYNCFTDTSFVMVTVGQYPLVSLGPDVILNTGTIWPITATIQNGPIATWWWSPPIELSCTTCPQPLAVIKKDISYSVHVTNIYGCSASDTINIKALCQSSQVYIPNAFTPDGDGINDILMVRGNGIVMVKSFRIFNRWGEVVFEKANFPTNNPAYGWTGAIRGTIGGPDVFVYTAEVICENGSMFTYKGNVSIIK